MKWQKLPAEYAVAEEKKSFIVQPLSIPIHSPSNIIHMKPQRYKPSPPKETKQSLSMRRYLSKQKVNHLQNSLNQHHQNQHQNQHQNHYLKHHYLNHYLKHYLKHHYLKHYHHHLNYNQIMKKKKKKKKIF